MSSISAAAGLDSQVRGALPNRFSELTTEEFIQIIFTELVNQDPLQPNDTSALLDQLDSIRSIESDLELSRSLERLVTENQLASASGLIGKQVTGRTEDLDRVTGMVVGAQREGDRVRLRLDGGAMVAIDDLDSIVDPAASGGTGATAEALASRLPDGEPF